MLDLELAPRNVRIWQLRNLATDTGVVIRLTVRVVTVIMVMVVVIVPMMIMVMTVVIVIMPFVCVRLRDIPARVAFFDTS